MADAGGIVFVFAEDASLQVVGGIEEVRRSCEPIDVESGVFAFYDADGRPLRAEFTRPNRTRRLLGILSSLEQGEYTLVAGAAANHDPISLSLLETSVLEPNSWFADLNAVREYLQARGAL